MQGNKQVLCFDQLAYYTESMKKHLGNASSNNGYVKNTLLSADGWSETAPYEQTVQVEGILETDSPFIECAEDVLTKEEKKLYRKQWDKIDRIVTGNGQITAYCYFEKPTLSLEIRIKGV